MASAAIARGRVNVDRSTPRATIPANYVAMCIGCLGAGAAGAAASAAVQPRPPALQHSLEGAVVVVPALGKAGGANGAANANGAADGSRRD